MLMNIKKLREDAQLTQSQLAERMDTLQSTVSNWESELALPRTRQLPLLANILECSIDDLFIRNSLESNLASDT